MILREFLNVCAARLAAAGVDSPRLSARVLAAHVLGCSGLELALRAETPLSPETAQAMEALISRRAAGEPVAYVTGVKEFHGRDFAVTPAVLIPRPETEEMVEAVLAAGLPDHARFADLGAGSGCISVVLAAERPGWQGCMLDISAAALAVAARNAARHAALNRLSPVRGDLRAPPLAPAAFDLIVSNPPYVSAAEYAEISPEVRDFEPAAALVPDPGGLALIRAVARAAAWLLRPGGLCFVEHGATQGQATREIFIQAGGWAQTDTGKDLAGHDRWCRCRRAGDEA